MYFPAALAGVAKMSLAGNAQHHPEARLHHDRTKSTDHGDCIMRHLMDLGDCLAALDRCAAPETAELVDRALKEASAVAWRALALSQELHEAFGGAPVAPNARTPTWSIDADQ